MGTPEFSVPVLEAIVAAGHEVVRVYTRPARVAGRGHKQRKTPVHQAADRLDLEVATPKSLRGADEIAALAALGADVGVVAAYGLILPQGVLDAPRYGCLNLHASLLPRWRGAAPIHRAVMAGDGESGVCVMRMTAGLDEGPVCLSARVAIDATTTTGDLHDALADAGAPLMCQALALLGKGGLDCTPQVDGGATYAEKISKPEAQIDFDRPAAEVLHHIHGLSPFPGAWFMVRSAPQQAVRVKVLRCEQATGSGKPGQVLDEKLTIACASGAIRPLAVQREGKGAMQPDELLRGFAMPPGTVITKA